MTSHWSTSSIDLLVPGDGGRQSGARLQEVIRTAVRSGRLPRWSRVPSTRALARDLGVARGTVVDAYAQLTAEGYLVARRGSGTVVAWAGEQSVSAPLEARSIHPSPIRYDFRAGTPDLTSFPRAAWIQSLRRAIWSAPAQVFSYGDPRGRIELRRTIAEYLGRVRGVTAHPEQVVICTGYAQALALLAQVLYQSGVTAVAVENPSLRWHQALLKRCGLQAIETDVDEEGLCVDRITNGVSAVIVTPAHQFPSGVVLTPSRRAALISWARRSKHLIIEDDYDGEFRYDRQPVEALQALDSKRVVYIGTASKTLAPALRIAWMVLPTELVPLVADAKAFADRQGPPIDQLALAALIEGRGYDRHVRKMRALYRIRRDELVSLLARQVPEARLSGIAAGLHVLVTFPKGAPHDSRFADCASAHGVAIRGLSYYATVSQGAPPSLVVGYAGVPKHHYSQGLDTLCAVLRDVLDHPAASDTMSNHFSEDLVPSTPWHEDFRLTIGGCADPQHDRH